MIQHVTTHAIEEGRYLPGLQACLTKQLARVQRREAKLHQRNNGGAPKREQDWR
jgi:hypothetical protein